MADIPVYSSRNVNVTWGEQSIVGLAPDTFIEISPSADITSESVGADGSLAISILPDDTGTVTISLQQNSPSNQTLAYAVNQMRITGDLVRADLEIDDPSGGSFVKIIGAHIKTKPPVSLGSDASGSTRDWVFFAEEVIYQPVDPSNTNAAQIIADVATTWGLLDKYLVS